MTNRDELPQYSRRIVSLREVLGMSQKELANLVGVTAPAVTMWESGVRFPRGKALSKLAKALGVSQSYLLDDFEEDQPPTPNNQPHPKTRHELIGAIVSALAPLNDSELRQVQGFIEDLTLLDTLAATKASKTTADF